MTGRGRRAEARADRALDVAGAALIPEVEVEALELDLLLEAVFQTWGYDFRDYTRASLRRRVAAAVTELGLPSISALQDRLLHDRDAMAVTLPRLTVHTTTMFRDPPFFRAVRELVIPYLRTYMFARIWVVGCSTGEEGYSMAIMASEAGLADRVRIYATDLVPSVLDRARDGRFPLSAMGEYAANYAAAGGERAFSEYYTTAGGDAIMREDLRDVIHFAQHDLASDTSFNEFQLILCRNVLIYFRSGLKQRVHELLYASLAPLGILGLGTHEVIQASPHARDFDEVDGAMRLYRRKPG